MDNLSILSLVNLKSSRLSLKRNLFGVKPECEDKGLTLLLRPYLESLSIEPKPDKVNLRVALELARLAGIAYSDPPPVSDVAARLQSPNTGSGCDRFRLEGSLIRSSKFLRDTEVFVAYNAHHEIVIAFRGTETKSMGALRDLFTDLGFTKTTYERRRRSGGKLNRLHRKFYQAYCDVQDDLVRRIWKLIDKLGDPSPRLYFTGHSLGGALATIAALDFAVRADDGDNSFPREHPITLYTFGSPRVLSHNMVKNLFSPLVSHSFAMANDNDPITGLPPVSSHRFRFSHINHVVVLASGGSFEILPGDKYRGKWISTGGHGIADYRSRLEKGLRR